MDAYVYRGGLYCGECASKIGRECSAFRDSEDSEEYPQGPYPNGGGDADTMQHCDDCGRFLKNPLTRDGIEYVLDALTDYVWNDREGIDVLKCWAEHLESMSIDWEFFPEGEKVLYAFNVLYHRSI